LQELELPDLSGGKFAANQRDEYDAK